MLNIERFTELLEKYALDKISSEERSEFLTLVTSGSYDDVLLKHIESNLQSDENDIAGVNIPPHRSADILYKIISSEKQNALLIPVASQKTRIIRWVAAAALIGAITCSVYLFGLKKDQNSFSTASYAKDLKAQVNMSRQPLKIELEEGSIVTLQPGSSIHYPIHFLRDKREIFLEGEAFFEVSKNASRPFFVYNKNIVTHVLGTSFNVKLNAESKQVEVSVRSGRVEVYENKSINKSAAGKNNNGVILLPNQKVTYDEGTRQFVPALVDVPLPVIAEQADKKTIPENFVFEETPLQIVLVSLEKSYGIDIMVEKETIYKCLFTGDISSQDLYSRLDIICQAVQASYEVKGTKILIKGNGCN